MVLMTALKNLSVEWCNVNTQGSTHKQKTKNDMICFNKIVTKKILSYWHLLFNLLDYTINNLWRI